MLREIMTERRTEALLRSSLWLCASGFLYEAIVDIPNLLGQNALNAQAVWAQYHHRSNPGWFFAIPMLVALTSMIWLRIRYPKRLPSWKGAFCSMIVLQGATGIAVGLINPELYFGGPLPDPSKLPLLTAAWGILNLVRLYAAFALLFSFRRR